MASQQPLLSVIITTFSMSRLPDLFDLLASLKAQTYPRIEIQFVGERTPELCERVREHARQQGMANVVVLFNEGRPGLSAARNVAIPEAKGELIAFLDDDVVAFPDWAEEMVRAFAEKDAIGVTGPAVPLWDDPGMSWFPEELYWIISCTAWSGWGQLHEVRNAWGMNMAFRREVFAVAGLFHEATGYHMGPFAEDNEFSLRVRFQTGKRILYVPGAKVSHRVHRYRLTGRFIRERSYWIGRSRRNLLRLYADSGTAEGLPSPERQLLHRVLFRRIPADLAHVLEDPRMAWKRLSVTCCALLFVALGYYSHLLPGHDSSITLRGSGDVGIPSA